MPFTLNKKIKACASVSTLSPSCINLMTYKGPRVLPTCYPSFPDFRGATCRTRPADAPRRNKGPKVPTPVIRVFLLSGAQLAGCGLQTHPAATKVLRCPPVIRVFQLSGPQLAGCGRQTHPAAITAEQPLRVELHQLVALQ
jgi:hypothetical protein